MNLEPLTERHYPEIYKIALSSEPWTTGMIFEQFRGVMQGREGYVLIHRDMVIGCISFSDYQPMCNVLIHCVVDTKYQKRWATKGILKQLFEYAYDTMDLPRMSAISIVGYSDKACEFLERLGFKPEGVIRKGVRLPDGLFDLKMFGMLKEECKWV